MRSAWLRALHPLGPVGAQGIAQAVNLLAQLGLAALLGKERFADLGLGLVAVNSVAFLGELGFSAYFLRETAKSSDWLDPWRHAAGSRLIGLVVLFAAAWGALIWGAPHPDLAASVLVPAIPGLIASTINPIPVLFGLNHVRMASAGVAGRFAIQAVGSLIAVLIWPDNAAIGIGLAFSAGFLFPLYLGQCAGLPRRAMLPLWPQWPPLAALRLWVLSVVGTVNDRALLFIIGSIQPDLLATALIVLQILQTMTGIGVQVDRLLIPETARNGETTAWQRLRRPLTPIAVFIPAAMTIAAFFLMHDYYWIAMLLGLEWSTVFIGALAFSVGFARGEERLVARFMLIVVPLSTLAQITLSEQAGLELVLALRVTVSTIVMGLAMQCAEKSRV